MISAITAIGTSPTPTIGIPHLFMLARDTGVTATAIGPAIIGAIIAAVAIGTMTTTAGGGVAITMAIIGAGTTMTRAKTMTTRARTTERQLSPRLGEARRGVKPIW